MKSTTEPSTLTSATYEDLVREMIVRLGEDPDREGLSRTPARVHKAMQFLVKGYKDDPETLPLLKDLARLDESGDVREAAAEELARGWKDDPEVRVIVDEAARS